MPYLILRSKIFLTKNVANKWEFLKMINSKEVSIIGGTFHNTKLGIGTYRVVSKCTIQNKQVAPPFPKMCTRC